MQHFEISCAAATLATVLTYGFHDAVAERPIAEGMLRYTSAAKVKSQGGFSMLDMKHVLADRGADPAFGNREMPIDTFTKLWIDGLAFVVSK